MRSYTLLAQCLHAKNNVLIASLSVRILLMPDAALMWLCASNRLEPAQWRPLLAGSTLDLRHCACALPENFRVNMP